MAHSITTNINLALSEGAYRHGFPTEIVWRSRWLQGLVETGEGPFQILSCRLFVGNDNPQVIQRPAAAS